MYSKNDNEQINYNSCELLWNDNRFIHMKIVLYSLCVMIHILDFCFNTSNDIRFLFYLLEFSAHNFSGTGSGLQLPTNGMFFMILFQLISFCIINT